MRRARALRRAALLALIGAACAGGCATQSEVRSAITDVNEAFRIEYERILAEKGSRTYPVRQSQAFAALQRALNRLGMRVADQAPELGYLNVYAPAPNPLNADEWRVAAEADLPRMREIAARHVGLVSWLVRFEPEGLDIVINATALGSATGTEISLTMRMRETSPPQSGIPRREYPPPTAVRMGLDKIWGDVDRQLGLAPRSS
jgi:hypothetical protein